MLHPPSDWCDSHLSSHCPPPSLAPAAKPPPPSPVHPTQAQQLETDGCQVEGGQSPSANTTMSVSGKDGVLESLLHRWVFPHIFYT